MAGPPRTWAVANDPDHEWTLAAMTAPTATRLLDNYVAGAVDAGAAPRRRARRTNPATGEVLARVPLSGARPRRGRRGRARGAARVARGVG